VVAARGGVRSLGLALSLASPGSLGCAREGEGVGGGGWGEVFRSSGDPRREAEAARDSGEAAGGAERFCEEGGKRKFVLFWISFFVI
jgi:hypothetical protein